MKKIKKIIIGSTIASTLLVAASASLFALNTNKQSVINVLKTNSNDATVISQNQPGGDLKNSDVYFQLDNISDWQDENGEYNNIIANLNEFQSNSPAKDELLKIANNLNDYKFWKTIEATSVNKIAVKEFQERQFPDYKFKTLDDVITSQQWIQELVKQLNGFTVGSSISINSKGGIREDGTTVTGARLINLKVSPAANVNRFVDLVTLNNPFNTIVKVAKISSSAREDIVLRFTIQSATETPRDGVIVIKAANNELSSIVSQNLDNYNQNLNIFGRWLNTSSRSVQGSEELKLFPNFVFARSSTGAGYELIAQVTEGQNISNLKIESGSSSITEFGFLDAQVQNTPFYSNNRISTISFFSTETTTTPIAGNQDHQNLQIFLGSNINADQSPTWVHPIYTADIPEGGQTTDSSYVQAVDENGNQVQMSLSYFADNISTPENAFKITPEKLFVTTAGGSSLEEGAINIINKTYRNNTYASFDINFNRRRFSFNRASADFDGTFKYDNKIILQTSQYASKIFFEAPFNVDALNVYPPKVISSSTRENNLVKAQLELAKVYNNWSQENNIQTTASVNFSNSPLNLQVLSAKVDELGQNKYIDINLFGQSEKFDGNGISLYKKINENLAYLNEVSNQLTGSNLQFEDSYRIKDGNEFEIIRNSIISTLNPTDTNRIIQVIIDEITSETATEASIYNIAEQQLGKLIELVFTQLLVKFRSQIDDLYIKALENFLGSTNLAVNNKFNVNFIQTNSYEKLRFNEINIPEDDPINKINLFSKNLSTSVLVDSETRSGEELAKSYIDLLFKQNFGSLLFNTILNNSVGIYNDLVTNGAAAQNNLASKVAISSEENKNKYLIIYSGLFRLIKQDWNAVLTNYLQKGNRIDIKGTGIGSTDVSFEKWFNQLNQELSQPLVTTFDIYGRVINSNLMDDLITAANISKSLEKRLQLHQWQVDNIASGFDSRPELNQQLKNRLEENLVSLQIIANYALVTNHVHPRSYIIDFNDPTKQLVLAEQIINDINLAQQVTYSTTGLQSVIAITAQQSNPTFIGIMFAFGSILMVAGTALVLMKKKSITALMTKGIKGVLYGTIALGALIIILAIIASVLL